MAAVTSSPHFSSGIPKTAASFTGRVIGPFAESGVVRFRDYAYQGGDGPNGLAQPGERVDL